MQQGSSHVRALVARTVGVCWAGVGVARPAHTRASRPMRGLQQRWCRGVRRESRETGRKSGCMQVSLWRSGVLQQHADTSSERPERIPSLRRQVHHTRYRARPPTTTAAIPATRR